MTARMPEGDLMELETTVPAKINLWLEVVRKRSDGYHDLSSLMLPIAIFDRLRLEAQPGDGIEIECECPGVPSDERNLAWQAAKRFLDAAGRRTSLRIKLQKSIPAGAGLGGGSADAAAVLLSLNRFFPGALLPVDIHSIARTLGADVPFFLYSRPAVATGIGEELQPVEEVPSYPLVLVKPPLVVSTGEVYQSLKLTRGSISINVQRLLSRPWQVRDVMENDLEAVTLVKYPLLAKIKDWLLERGALGALMSGSGPTVFGVFPDHARAESIGVAAETEWAGCWVAVTRVISSSEAPADQSGESGDPVVCNRVIIGN